MLSSKLSMVSVATSSVMNVQDVVAQLGKGVQQETGLWSRRDRIQTPPAPAPARNDALQEAMPGVKITKRTLDPINNLEKWIEFGLQSDKAFFTLVTSNDALLM